MLYKKDTKVLKVVAEDTDLFVLSCHSYYNQQWKIQLFMESFGVEKSLTCIKPSECNVSLMQSLLSAHAFGCDTVPAMFGVGKKTMLKFGEISSF